MTLAEATATEAANSYLNYHCQQMDMPEKLRHWQQVYDTTLAALTYMEYVLIERQREALAHVSAN